MVSLDNLMRGDYIYYIGVYNKPEICIVDGITNKGISVKSSYGWTPPIEPDKFKPILLTEKILLDNGFTKSSSIGLEFYTFNHLSVEKLNDTFMWGCHHDIMISGIDDIKETNPMGKSEYVHELQHALKSCNIDIKLNIK